MYIYYLLTALPTKNLRTLRQLYSIRLRFAFTLSIRDSVRIPAITCWATSATLRSDGEWPAAIKCVFWRTIVDSLRGGRKAKASSCGGTDDELSLQLSSLVCR